MSFTTHTPPPSWWTATRRPVSPDDWEEAVRRHALSPFRFGDLLRLFGAGSGDVISGRAVAVFRKEGW